MWNRLWVKVFRFICAGFVNVWSQIFVFARTSFPFLSRAEKISWCRAHGKLSCCASTDTGCHWQIPAASICKYDTLVTMPRGICTVVQWESFIQALCYVRCSATHYISCLLSLLCYTCSSVTVTPYSPSVWGAVGLGFFKLYWLPVASSMCCSGTHSKTHFHALEDAFLPSKVLGVLAAELCSRTDWDLRLGNSAEGKPPPRSGWCLVWTQHRWCSHPGTGSVHDGLWWIFSPSPLLFSELR